MKLAYVWYNPVERSMIESLIRSDRPDWKLQCIHESQVGDLVSAIRLLKSEHSAIMLHLSTPPCLALKLAELIHRNQLGIRLALFSRTPADPAAVRALFACHVDPDRDVTRLADRLDELLKAPMAHLQTDEAIEAAIVRILNTDDVFQHQFRLYFPVLYRAPFAVDDYRKFAEACLNADPTRAGAISARRVFVSHATKDEDLALEVRHHLEARHVASFMAARDIEGGSPWQEEIREAIRTCAEILILLTPNSIDRRWVMIEAGAAWALGKRITPCLAYVERDAVPEPLATQQCRGLKTPAQIAEVADEVAARINGS